MKHPFLLWLALLFSLLTATSRADHFKGGALSWTRLTAEPGFTVKADVTVSFDLSSPYITPVDQENTPKVKGQWVYTENMPVSTGCEIVWGDGSTNTTLTEFTVVSVDFAAQLVVVKATNAAAVTHAYTTNGTYTMAILGYVRDHDEELANRQETAMRVESTVPVNTTTPSANRPPVFNLANSKLILVPQGSGTTFNAPVATDADGDPISYHFVATEGNATQGGGGGAPWETQPANGLSITTGGVVSWNTSGIEQTVKTYAIQVVAKDLDGSGNEKSRSTIEFQAWINESGTTQTGVPEIELRPSFTSYTAYVGQPIQFKIVGTDHDSLGEPENSRLEAVIPALNMPPGAVLVPSGGFAGQVGDDIEEMEAVFSWTPLLGQVGTWELPITVVDEDGHESSEVIVTIEVEETNPAEPLVLRVTPSTPATEPDTVKVIGHPGEELSFVVQGSSTDLALELYTEDELPGDAEMNPVLPEGGTSMVESTFTWEPTEEDVTGSDPYPVTFILGDNQGREVTQTVEIYILPDKPTITLAPGEPSTITAQPWQTFTFDFIATSGDETDTSLTIGSEVGSVDVVNAPSSPHNGTFTLHFMPGQLPKGVVNVTATDVHGQTATLAVPVTILYDATPPGWWSAHNVLDSGADPFDHGIANTGQLKAITKAAFDALEDEYPTLTSTTEGAALDSFVDGFASTGNRAPVLQGQVKNAAELVYRAMESVIGKGEIGSAWSPVATDDKNYAPTKVGQLKMLFSFPTSPDALFNEAPEVALTSPLGTENFDDRDTITIAATATDGDGTIASVKFYADDTLLTTLSSGPYSYAWDVPAPGTYVIKAVATDNGGAVRTASRQIHVNTWGNTAPSVTITSPTGTPDHFTPAVVTVSANVSDVDGPIEEVRFYLDDVLFAVDTTSPYSAPTPKIFPVKNNYVVKVEAEDFDNGVTAVTANFDVIQPTNGTIISFQEGVDGYSGKMIDTYISGKDGGPGGGDQRDTNFGDSTQLIAQDSPNRAMLLKWDLTGLGLPADLPVESGQIVLWVEGQSGKNYGVYPVKKAWNELEATWREPWTTDGAQGIGTDREANADGWMWGNTTGPKEAALRKETVIAWLNNPAENHGVTIQNYVKFGTNPLEVSSSESLTPSHRPILKIWYKY